MDLSRKARFGGVSFQRAFSFTYGLWLQAFHPAAPDGVRGQGSCLHIGLDALPLYRTTPPRFDLLTHHFASCLLSFRTFPSCSVYYFHCCQRHAATASLGFHMISLKALPLARTAQAVLANLLANAATK